MEHFGQSYHFTKTYLNSGFKIRHFEKKSRGKKLKTQGKNSITQGKNLSFLQFYHRFLLFLANQLDFSHDITIFNHFCRGYTVVLLKNEQTS